MEPLGEGAIELGAEGKCWVRCPWHGWGFHPLSGKSPGAHDNGQSMYPLELRDDGVDVAIPRQESETASVFEVMGQTMTPWGAALCSALSGTPIWAWPRRYANTLSKQEVAGTLCFIAVRHEGAAAFAASGYAKLSGKPAACLAIAGPGATNLLTGLWGAKVERAPVLTLTGQVDSQVLGPGAFQEIDLASAFDAVSAFSQTVLHSSRHPELMSLALKNAIVERGVSHLIFPDEVQVLAAPENAAPSSPAGRLTSPNISPDPDQLKRAVNAIRRMKRPIISVGYGARNAMPAIIELAEKLRCAVLPTFKAKGQIADNHRLAAGVLG